jgi:hypothetical protein
LEPHFVDEQPKPKTKVWAVWTKSQPFVVLGFVKWFARWYKYAFFPEPEMLFEQTCLREIADFCEHQTKAHKLKNQDIAQDG